MRPVDPLDAAGDRGTPEARRECLVDLLDDAIARVKWLPSESPYREMLAELCSRRARALRGEAPTRDEICGAAGAVCSTCGKTENPICSNAYHLAATAPLQAAPIPECIFSPSKDKHDWSPAHEFCRACGVTWAVFREFGAAAQPIPPGECAAWEALEATVEALEEVFDCLGTSRAELDARDFMKAASAALSALCPCEGIRAESLRYLQTAGYYSDLHGRAIERAEKAEAECAQLRAQVAGKDSR